MYFLPLVFIGAFFLLNLTLAVINSKFTEAHNEQADMETKKESKEGEEEDDGEDGEEEEDDDGNSFKKKKKYSIPEFVKGRIYT